MLCCPSMCQSLSYHSENPNFQMLKTHLQHPESLLNPPGAYSLTGCPHQLFPSRDWATLKEKQLNHFMKSSDKNPTLVFLPLSQTIIVTCFLFPGPCFACSCNPSLTSCFHAMTQAGDSEQGAQPASDPQLSWQLHCFPGGEMM